MFLMSLHNAHAAVEIRHVDLKSLMCNFKIWFIQAYPFTVQANLQIQCNDPVSMYFTYSIDVTLRIIQKYLVLVTLQMISSGIILDFILWMSGKICKKSEKKCHCNPWTK